MDITVLYYTSNVEDDNFSCNIREMLLASKGDLPLVSVSQKPLDGFGHNICVGQHSNSYFNEFRQIQVGLRAVKTPFILVAESDTLYPPEYFRPSGPEPVNHRFYSNVWVQLTKRPYFILKGRSHAAQLVNVEAWLDRITTSFEGLPPWLDTPDQEIEGKGVYQQFPESLPPEPMFDGNAVVTFKTGKGVRRTTAGANKMEVNLPYWGNSIELICKMFELNNADLTIGEDFIKY